MNTIDYIEHPWSPIEITLTLSHPHLVPESITEALGLSPTRTTAAGAAAHSVDGFWVLEFTGNPTRMDNPIPDAIQILSNRVETIHMLVATGVKATLTIEAPVRDGATLRFCESDIVLLTELQLPVNLLCNGN